MVMINSDFAMGSICDFPYANDISSNEDKHVSSGDLSNKDDNKTLKFVFFFL